MLLFPSDYELSLPCSANNIMIIVHSSDHNGISCDTDQKVMPEVLKAMVSIIREMLSNPIEWFSIFYDEVTFWAQNGLLVCPDCGCCTMACHGGYERCILIGLNVTKVVIRRVRCTNEECRKTHAVVPFFIVPVSRILVSDVLAILKENGKDVTGPAVSTELSPDSEAVRMIMNKYYMGWRKLLKSHSIKMDALICSECIRKTGYQFLQGLWSKETGRFRTGQVFLKYQIF